MTATIGVGNDPFGVAVNPTTNLIYVTNYSSGSVSVISVFPTPTNPSITNLPGSGTFNDSFTPVVSTTGDGSTSVTSSTTSVCTVTAGTVNYIGVGTCTLVAHVAEGSNYASAEGVGQIFIVSAVAPSVPGQPVLTDKHGSILATWSAATSTGGAAVTYAVAVRTGSGYPVIVARGLTSTSFTFDGSTVGKTYTFWVVALNSFGYSPWSANTSLDATAVKPSLPRALVVTYVNGSLRLKWSAPENTGGDKVTYVISQMFNHGNWTNLTAQLSATSYLCHPTLKKGTYVFTVAAVNSAGRSGFSGPALLTVK